MIRIIVDSCCDFSQELKARISPLIVPFTVNTGDDTVYVDDDSADMDALMHDLTVEKKRTRSTCPSPDAYMAQMLQCDACFVITISSRLSGSYNAACVAKSMVLETAPHMQIHIFDSKSAVVGETQLAVFLHEQIEANKSFDAIIPLANAFLKQARTYFVLEDLGNLLHNGRLQDVAGRIAGMIHLCPVMGEDGEGNIRLVAPSLGIERALRKLLDQVAQNVSSARAQSISLYIGFCNCYERALKVKNRFLQKCPQLRDVLLVPTGVLSTTYANNGGIVIAFQSPALESR